METFSWNPDKGVEVTPDLAVREIQLGDGVVQVQQRFLTAPKHTFNLTFTRPAAEIDTIYNFLTARRGQRFIWRRVDGVTYTVRSVTFKRTYTGIVDTLTCEFKEEHI